MSIKVHYLRKPHEPLHTCIVSAASASDSPLYRSAGSFPGISSHLHKPILSSESVLHHPKERPARRRRALPTSRRGSRNDAQKLLEGCVGTGAENTKRNTRVTGIRMPREGRGCGPRLGVLAAESLFSTTSGGSGLKGPAKPADVAGRNEFCPRSRKAGREASLTVMCCRQAR